MKLFFVTVLILTTKTPVEGWIQYTESFSDKKVCEQVIRKDYDTIASAAATHLSKVFVSIKEMRCMTYQDAVMANTQLGH